MSADSFSFGVYFKQKPIFIAGKEEGYLIIL